MDEIAFEPHVDDDVLRLMFTACHPVLSVEARVALTLKMVAGLSTRSAWPRTVDRSRACAHRHDARSHEALFRRRADHHLHEIGSLFARERSLPYERVPCHERDRVADGCRRAHALTTSLAASRHQ